MFQPCRQRSPSHLDLLACDPSMDSNPQIDLVILQTDKKNGNREKH